MAATVHVTEVVQGPEFALHGGLAVPTCPFGMIPRHAFAEVVQQAEAKLSGGVVILGQLAVLSLRRGKVSTKIRR